MRIARTLDPGRARVRVVPGLRERDCRAPLSIRAHQVTADAVRTQRVHRLARRRCRVFVTRATPGMDSSAWPSQRVPSITEDAMHTPAVQPDRHACVTTGIAATAKRAYPSMFASSRIVAGAIQTPRVCRLLPVGRRVCVATDTQGTAS